MGQSKFADHREFLVKTRCAGDRVIKEYFYDLNDEEAEIIEKYYGWMIGLVEGILDPQTKAQERLIAVADGREKPESEIEKTFMKVRDLQGKKFGANQAARAKTGIKKRAARSKAKPQKVEKNDGLLTLREGQICICRGTNPNCAKCDGSGWDPTRRY